MFVAGDGVSFEVEELVQILLGTVLLVEKFAFEPVQSVLQPAVLFNQLDVLLGQILLVLTE